jgi:uncharacterized cupredoxin-like copper-binding protein
MKRLAVLAPFVIAAVIAGCGSSSSATSASSTVSGAGSAAAAPSGGSAGLTLDESEFKIDPANPKVAKTGEITVTVKNTGAITHALTVQTPSGPVSTGSIAPGRTTTLKVNISKAGTYKFFCPIPGHEQSGMKGSLVVG